MISYIRTHSQCNVTISSTAPAVLCSPGNINISANGTGAVTAVLDNDFDAGNAGVGWNVSPAGQFNNPCDPSIDGGTYMWMGNTTAAPRTLETVPLDVDCGGQICFYFDMAAQGDLSPCEGPDKLMREFILNIQLMEVLLGQPFIILLLTTMEVLMQHAPVVVTLLLGINIVIPFQVQLKQQILYLDGTKVVVLIPAMIIGV